MERKENSTEITFNEMREKEIVNVFDGKRLGRILDLVFDVKTNAVLGIVVPPIRKFFSRKSDDIFIPLELIEKIGDDVVLVCLAPNSKDEILSKKQNVRKELYSEFSRELTSK